MKTKNLFQQLLPEVKLELNSSVSKYATAKRLKYVLMSKSVWSELNIEQLRNLTTFANPTENSDNRYTYDAMLFGTGFIKKDY